uniref:Uncharacterized protein n=1 Tax=Aquila chrysaetos chrysaetos TaxID=223781 RepID=A0A663EBN5_AQUCH
REWARRAVLQDEGLSQPMEGSCVAMAPSAPYKTRAPGAHLKQCSSNQPIIQKKRSKCTQPLCAELCLEALFSESPGVISSISLQRFVTHSEIRSPVASPVGFRGVCLPR